MSDLTRCDNCGEDTAEAKYYKPFKYCPPCYDEGLF